MVGTAQKKIKKMAGDQTSEPGIEHAIEVPRARIKLVRWTPQVLSKGHEETHFELFYDLIIVVVLMNLGYLKVKEPM